MLSTFRNDFWMRVVCFPTWTTTFKRLLIRSFINKNVDIELSKLMCAKSLNYKEYPVCETGRHSPMEAKKTVLPVMHLTNQFIPPRKTIFIFFLCYASTAKACLLGPKQRKFSGTKQKELVRLNRCLQVWKYLPATCLSFVKKAMSEKRLKKRRESLYKKRHALQSFDKKCLASLTRAQSCSDVRVTHSFCHFNILMT